MMAVPRYPRLRRAGPLRRAIYTLRRAWLVHQIIGVQVEIRSLQKMIDNDSEVARRYPDQQPKILPDIDRRFLEQQALSKRLSTLQIRLLALNHGI